MREVPRFVWFLLGALGFVLALPSLVHGLLWHWEQSPVLRGSELAESAGCLGCHDPVAGLEIPNPGSSWGAIPWFEPGGVMMSAEGRQEIEEFIRYGAPLAWLDDPALTLDMEAQLIRMPAYEQRLGEREIDDLVAWSMAVEGIDLPKGDPSVPAGRRLARKHGCVSCHGIEGAGGVPNPGSLGGFVPGFRGENFADLVRDEAEFREWVLEGTSQRLESYAWIRFFWERQTLQMPAYRGHLDDEEVSHLWSWIQAIRSPPTSP